MISHAVEVRCRKCAKEHGETGDDVYWILGEFYDHYWASMTADKHNYYTGHSAALYLSEGD